MVRTINYAERSARRNEILDAAERLIYTRGYERMTIQDILVDLGISNGAFFHYFASKPAVLEALIERMQHQAEQPLLAIVNAPDTTALEKLQQYFATLDRAGSAYQNFIADLVRVWLADDNAIVREKVYAAMAARRAPLLARVIRQGIQEGVFRTAYPDQTAQNLQFMMRGVGDTLVRHMLLLDEEPNQEPVIAEIVATYAAYADALERLLSAPSGCLVRYDSQAVQELVAGLRRRSSKKGLRET
jgi:AcrR family transcriptional regulator